MQAVTKFLLLEYHAGRATPLQVKLIEDWLREPAHESLYYETLFEWESASPQYLVDTAAALDAYRHRLSEPVPRRGGVPFAEPTARRWHFPAWLVAASALLAVLSGWWFRDTIRYQTHTTGFGEIKSLALPDGSRVTLNANSTLRVPRFGFGREWPWVPGREVKLTGEAEFSVVHTQTQQRFVVKTRRNLNVEVLGTEFGVFTRDRATRVVLARGKVKLSYRHPNTRPAELTMRPGQQVTLDEHGSLILRNNVKPREVLAWKERRYVFNDTPLREIGYLIHENYGLCVDILSPALASRMVTGTYEATNADELLLALGQLLDIQITRKKNKVIFSEKPVSSKTK